MHLDLGEVSKRLRAPTYKVCRMFGESPTGSIRGLELPIMRVASSIYTAAVVTGGYLSYKVYKDYQWLPSKQQELGLSAAEMADELRVLAVSSRYEGEEDERIEVKKLQVVRNLYADVLKDADLAARFSTVAQLPRFYDPTLSQDAFFIVLPLIYCRRMHNPEVTRELDGQPLGLTPQQEAASWYSKFTRDLCRSYFLRRGFSGWVTYAEFCLVDAAFVIAISAVGSLGVRWVRVRLESLHKQNAQALNAAGLENKTER